MAGNVKKIRERHSKDPAKYTTLQSMVIDEVSMPKKERVCTEGLMWLRRGLEFTSLAIRINVDNPQEELTVSFGKSYDQTLSKHHNMFIRPVFHLAMKATPARAEFYKKLGGDDLNKTMETLKPWLEGLENNVKILVDFYHTEKHEY